MFKTDYFRQRADSATALCHAIADCHQADACQIMETALDGLRAGMPRAPFAGLMSEARCWADWSTRNELKAYCAACFIAMRPSDRAAFLAFVGAEVI